MKKAEAPGGCLGGYFLRVKEILRLLYAFHYVAQEYIAHIFEISLVINV